MNPPPSGGNRPRKASGPGARLSPTARAIRAGDRRVLARLISDVEAREPATRSILEELYPYTGRIPVIGISGPLGVGKSSLVNLLIQHLRGRGKKVGVIAVDPTSPFSGGAVLGDRIRIQRPAEDTGVFLRSMASRGHSGGVSQSTREVIRLLEAFGMDVVLVETVGSGQVDVEIHEIASTRVVVLVPHLGDDVQTMKAGLFEIADVFAVNKADLPGADEAAHHLMELIRTAPAGEKWHPRIVKTSAQIPLGIPELWEVVEAHESYLREGVPGEQARQRRLRQELRDLVTGRFAGELEDAMDRDPALDRLFQKVAEGTLDPYRAADRVYESLRKR